MSTIFNDTYEVKEVIGSGGMSTVYLAEHKRLHTRWALKEVRKQQGARFDFLAESNILKRLQHPMLPRIVDIFEDPDHIYIVEDFVEGITLETLLKQQKKVNEVQGLQWFKELCGVLRYLHTQQPNPIIYRDMKPSNIMLQPDGSLKLIDFGIAREYKQESAADTTYIGTKGYAAPEQFGTAQSDARTDIYALGVTMYHLVTGKSPYEPPYNFVPVRQLDAGLSAGIEFILNKCIQSEPERRYQSVDELLDDLNNIHRFDKAWKKYQNKKRMRVALVAVTLAAGIGLIVGGRSMMAAEKEAAYHALLEQAAGQYLSDYDGALDTLEQAQTLFPERVDSYRQYTYALYLNKDYEDCVDYGERTLKSFPDDGQTLLTTASAYFELGEYEKAAEDFYQGALTSELHMDHLRDYAVCLGRMGDIDGAEEILEELTAQNAEEDATTYVRGEVYLAQEDYLAAENAFLTVLEETEDERLLRRCYVSLGDLYRDCAALVRISASPIQNPATKSAEILSEGLTTHGWRHDRVLWEMLALAYFESYHTDPNAPANYLNKAADCFNLVIELGGQREYLYTNLYSIYYEMKNYEKANEALNAYQQVFPDDYMPHALRGMMLITQENEKPQAQRDYDGALEAYETAGTLIRSDDETTYYLQLESLIDSLRANGWL